MAELVKSKSRLKKKSKHITQSLDSTDVDNDLQDVESLREVLKEITAEKNEATEVQYESECCSQEFVAILTEDSGDRANEVETIKNIATTEIETINETIKTDEPEKTAEQAIIAPIYPGLSGEVFPSPLLEESQTEMGNQSKTISPIYPPLEAIGSTHIEEECDEGVIVSSNDILPIYPLIRDISIELPPILQSETKPHLYPLLVNKDIFPPSGLVCSPSAPSLEDEDNELGIVLPKSHQESEMVGPLMEPFTEDQIRTLYYNPEMENLDIIIDRFFQNSTGTDHDFYRMVHAYQLALDKSQSISEDLEVLRKTLEDDENLVWEVKTHSETLTGRCQDGASVQKVIIYETTSVNADACLKFSESQINVRDVLHGDFVSSMFASHSSKLRIENYISNFFDEHQHLSVMPHINPLRGRGHDPQLENKIEELKEMIMILFAFQRKHITNRQFLDDTRSWLAAMVSRLLLHATFEDHLFLTLHVLHCPPGISRWAVGFVQSTEERNFDNGGLHVWDNQEFNHNVAVLALILKPMKYREEMLVMNRIDEELLKDEDKGWIMVDSEGEDDERPESVEVLFHEKDILSLLNQLSFEKSLKHLFMPGDDQDQLQFSNESNFVRMLAFARRAVDIIGVAMRNYPQTKYKRLNKKLGQMIRHIVHSLCLGWVVFKSHDFQIPTQMSQRIQMEADTILLLSVVRILQAPSMGAWQYLSMLPFDTLTVTSVWNLLRIIHLLCRDQSSDICNTYIPLRECLEDLSEERVMNEFGEKLSQMTSNEATFLLNTMANIAGLRGCDSRILEFITKEIFLICFVFTTTRASYSKLGRELLQSTCLQHPTITCEILKWTESHLSEIGIASSYLFQALPLHVLQLSQTNCNLLRSWLVHCLPSDPANRLARLILNCLDWSFRWDIYGCQQDSCSQSSSTWPQGAVRLFLPTYVHKFMATSVFEALYILLLGKASTVKLPIDAVMAFPTNFFTSNGNGSTTKLSSLLPSQNQSNDLQSFSTWAWCFCLHLRLHKFSELSGRYFFVKRNVAFEPESSNLLSRVLGEIISFAQNPHMNGDDGDSVKLEDFDGKSQLYSYLLFSLHSLGYSTSEFISDGLQRLLNLLEANFFVPVLHCFFNCLPMFYANKKAIVELLNCENLPRCFDLILKQDAVEKISFDSKSRSSITLQLSALILMHMELFSSRLDLLENVTNFWFYLLTKIVNWSRCRDVLYIVNNIIERLFATDPQLNISITFFKDILKGQRPTTSPVSQSGGFLSSITNLFWSRSSEFLSESPALKDFPWFRLVVLSAERRSYEEENNLIGLLESKIHGNMESAEFVEKIYENVCSRIGVDHVAFPLQKLSIFRCASMILETPVTHELLPLLWNEFLGYYFIRSSRSSCGLGYNLLSYSPESRALMKKLKDKCRTSMEELKQVADHFADKSIPGKLERLYRAILLWLDEQRLHSWELSLKSLPSQYAAPLFQSLINKQQEPWFGFVDLERMKERLNDIIETWFQNVLEKNAKPHQEHLNKLASSLEVQTPQKRLLTSFTNKPPSQIIPPPKVERLDCVFSELTPDIYLDERKLNVIIHGDLKIICEMASMHEKKLRKHVEMDEYYSDNLKKLYNNITVETLAVVPCWSYINPTHKCRGGAVLRKRHDQRQLNEMVNRKMNEVKDIISLLIKETSKMASLVTASRAVVRSEAIIFKLIRQVLKANQNNLTSEEHSLAARNAEMGINLFYLLVSFITPLIDHCPSAKQFTYSCIEALGKALIVDNPTQPRTLFLVILKTPELVCQLSPFFNPNSNPESFVGLYEELRTLVGSGKYDTTASLAAKFDINSWSKFSIHDSESNLRLLNFIVSALSLLGQKPRDEAQSLCCVFRSHLRILCLTNIPFYLMPLLQSLLSVSENQSLSPEVWEDYMSLLGFDFANQVTAFSFENAFHPRHSILITKHQIFQLLDHMSAFFGSQLMTSQEQCRMATGNRRNWDVSPGEYPWLYYRWRSYVPHLSRVFYSTATLLVIRVREMIDSSTAYDTASVVKDVTDMHGRIQSLYLPFIGRSCLSRCWLENISATAEAESDISCMIASWVASIEILHDHFEHDKLQCGILNHTCSFYVNDLQVREMPDFLANTFNLHLATLPWNHFEPRLICINNMAEAIRSTKPCVEMMGNVFCAVDWKNVFPALTTGISSSEVHQLHSLIFDILLRLACEEAILENTVLPQLLSTTEIFDWPTMLDAPSYGQSLQWFAENCDPMPLITFDLTLKSCQVLRLLKEACGFYPNKDNIKVSANEFHEQMARQNLFRKRCSYLSFIVNIFCKLSSARNPQFDRLEVALSNLLSEVDAILSKENVETTTDHHARKLCVECLSLLNHCPPTAANLFLQVFQLWMESSVTSILIPSMVLSACRTLNNVSHLSRLLETFLTSHFSLDVTATEHYGWNRVLASIEFPETCQEEFVAECLDKEYYLTLYSFILFKLSICQSLSDELSVMLKLNDWNTSAKLSASNESKIFLWWHKILELSARQATLGGSKLAVRSALVQMVPTLMVLGEDKATTGLFGAIGFGKRSNMSLRFRVVACGFAALVSSVLVNDVDLRPAGEHELDDLSTMLKATDAQVVVQLQQQTSSRLQGILHDKAYSNYSQHIQLAVRLSQDKSMKLRNFGEVMSQLISPMYQEYYLGVLQSNFE